MDARQSEIFSLNLEQNNMFEFAAVTTIETELNVANGEWADVTSGAQEQSEAVGKM